MNTTIGTPDPFDGSAHATVDAVDLVRPIQDPLLSEEWDRPDRDRCEPVAVWAHLHGEDCPATLAVLDVLFGHRLEAAKWIGYDATEFGAYVDWDALVNSWLSTTETAVVHIAHGCSIAERHGGGLPAGLGWAVTDAITAITTGR